MEGGVLGSVETEENRLGNDVTRPDQRPLG